MKVEVHVTRQMIDYALEQTSTRCAVSLALKDADDAYILPMVDQDYIRVTNRSSGERLTFTTPARIAKFIDEWDRGIKLMKPFSFTLDTDEADVRPIRHMQPSELIRTAERVRRVRQVQAQAGVARSHRPLREV